MVVVRVLKPALNACRSSSRPKTIGARRQGAEMKTQLAACICIALTQPCFGDQTLFTCREGSTHTYRAEGGQQKPGWSISETRKNVTKLIQTNPAEKGSYFDIQVTTDSGIYSSLGDSCSVREKFDPDISNPDSTFVVACQEMISTYLFFTRNGVIQLFETHLSLSHDSTAASVSATKNCKRGD
jgi:hypothetical protein